MKTLLTFLLLCAPLAAAPPEPPKVPAKVVVPAGEPVVIVGETDCKAVEYHPLTPGLKVPSIVKALNIPIPPKNYVGEGQPGTYKLLAWTGNADGPSKAVEIEVVIGDGKKKEEKKVTPKPEPAPKPNPKPKPKPDPKPTAKAVYIAVVRDSGSIAQPLATLLGDTPFWDSFKAAGHEWDIYDDSPTDDSGADTVANKKGYLRLAQRVQKTGEPFVPTLIVLDKTTGAILKVAALPGDKAGVAAAVKEVVK